MMYRDPLEPPADAEPAALMELAARIRRLRLIVLYPGIVLGILAGFAGAIAHGIGEWSVLGTFPDGSYLIHKGTLVIAVTIPMAPAFGAVWLVYTGLRARVRRVWRIDAGQRFRLGEDELRDIERMLH